MVDLWNFIDYYEDRKGLSIDYEENTIFNEFLLNKKKNHVRYCEWSNNICSCIGIKLNNKKVNMVNVSFAAKWLYNKGFDDKNLFVHYHGTPCANAIILVDPL